jgi:hypothetical protein
MGFRSGALLLFTFVALAVAGGAQASAAAEFSAEPSQVNFGGHVVGLDYTSRYVDVYGNSETPVTITSVELTGPDAADFELEDYCSDSEIDDFTGCGFLIGFQADAVGEKTATVQLTADSGDPVSVPISGSGVEPASNAPDLAAVTVNPKLTDTSDLWGYAGGDFQGEGRSGVVTLSQMDDYAIDAGFAFGQEDGLLTNFFGREAAAGGFPGTADVGDFNNDGDLDAIAGAGGQASLFLNQGDGDMDSGTAIPDDGNGIDAMIVSGEFTGDSNLDVAAGYIPDDDSSPYVIEVMPGLGDGTFGTPITSGADADSPLGIASGDFDDDGVSDLAYTTWAGQVLMYEGDGDGTFTEAGRFGPTCGCQSPWGVTAADLNGDGRDDVVATMRFEDQVAVYLAQPDGSFVRGQRFDVPLTDGWNPNPYAVSAKDMNGDGAPDLLVGNYLNDTGTVFVGHGDGTFDYAEPLATIDSFFPHGTFIGDFNGDGRADPSMAGQSGEIAIYLNEGNPGQVPSPTSVDFGEQTSGTESAAQTVTLNNEAGLAQLRVSDVSIGGGDSSDFQITGGDCLDGPILVGSSCQVQVAFTPNGPGGERASTIFFDTNHSDETQVSVPLSGDATDPAPGISVDPSSHDFGNVQVGKQSATKTFSITSTGDAPLQVTDVTVSGSGASAFVQSSNTCTGAIAPGQGCELKYSFKPTATGSSSATVHLATNVAGDPANIGLTGTGSAAPAPAPKAKVIIKKKPRAKIRIKGKRLRRVKVAFKSNVVGAGFRCRIDRRKFSKCKSPRIYKKINPGKHVIRIKAVKNGKFGPVKVIKFRVIRRR